jgi:hypothetical protein
MPLSKFSIYISILIVFISFQFVYASGTMKEDDVKNVKRIEVTTDEDKEKLSKTAGLLANYEITAKKLISNLKNETGNAKETNKQAEQLLILSEKIISSAQFRLPQCNEYLEKTLSLKNQLQNISHETLEKDYHHDGALPKAPAECYHTKDLFVHPATVIILTRDDPSLTADTKSSIYAEITEVLAHTELVRKLVIY